MESEGAGRVRAEGLTAAREGLSALAEGQAEARGTVGPAGEGAQLGGGPAAGTRAGRGRRRDPGSRKLKSARAVDQN